MNDHVIDLSKNHGEYRHGDLMVYCTWLRTGDNWRPCLAIIRAGEEYNAHTVPCILPLDKAWIFSDVGEEYKAVMIVIGFAQALRMEAHRKKDLMRIMTIINDHLGDLVSMPPRPDTDRVTVAELIITNPNTGKSRDILITESS